MSHLQLMELCGGIKKTFWELSQLVTIEIPVKERPQIKLSLYHMSILQCLVSPVHA